jgi:hypothetical protein
VRMGSENDRPVGGGDALLEPVVERRSLREEAWREACRERWYRSEEAGTDMGDEAVRRWVRGHWRGFVRVRWIEHLAGERFWVELDRADFGRLAEVPADQRPLLDEILERMRRGDENLDIIRWARREKTPEVQRAICELLGLINDNAHRRRYIFGSPFRPIVFDPKWRTEDVLGLALGIYEDGAFDRLPMLADALMDAGCDDEQILGRCRSDGPHVRGCWVVDLVLGKE